jgi:adenylate kinase family enzyme
LTNRIHILGASGSGTTTLAGALCKHLGWEFFDTDDYFWEATNPPFQKKRDVEERIALLTEKLDNTERWILSGSLCGWGDVFIPYFALVVFLWLPEDIRLSRLIERERERYGKEIEVGGAMHEAHLVFIDWASQYDKGDMNIRSRVMHEEWLGNLSCPVLRLEGDISLEEKIQKVLEVL